MPEPTPSRRTCSSCPDESRILRVASGGAAPAVRAEVVDHVADCAECAWLLAELASGIGSREKDSDSPARAEEPEVASERYRIEAVLGAGGMGIVYRAYDARLERRVALKVLRRADAPARTGAALLAEARVMARLAHPNVVQVLDVGTFDRRVFVAMELVAGGTLRSWLAEAPRTTREILDVFESAAKGLAAAHRRGIVHRDFKPENVLVEARAPGASAPRVLVSDFGLARQGSVDLDLRSGRAGGVEASAIAGTPAYMSPEQLLGQPLDLRSDVFAFAVALYEALYGQRPFVTTDRSSLLLRIAEGPRDVPPGVLSRAGHRALVAALAYERRNRPTSVEALVAACSATDRPSVTRGRVFAVAATAVGLVVIGASALAGTVVSTEHGARRESEAPARPGDAAPRSRIEAVARTGLGAPLAAASTRTALAGPATTTAVALPTASASATVSVATPLASSAVSAPSASASHARVGNTGPVRLRAFAGTFEPFGEDTPPVFSRGGVALGSCAPVACVAPRGDGVEWGDVHCSVHVAADGTTSALRCDTFVGDDRPAACPALVACMAGKVARLPPPSTPGGCQMNAYFSR